jgi:hypothetical protein
MTIDWEHFQREAADNAPALFDIYVFDTGAHDWELLLGLLRDGPFKLTFSGDSRPCPLPSTVREIFEMKATTAVSLNIDFSGLTANCFFFTPEEIELDIDPREFRFETQLNSLSTLIAGIGDLLNKEVVLALENSPQQRVTVYSPHTKEFQVCRAY